MIHMPIRVVIAEDHAVVREGTREILERDSRLQAVGEAEDGQQAVDLAAELKPDVMVLDLRLPVISGIEAARRIRLVSPETKIMVLSAYDDDDYVLAAMQAGVAGYLLKTAHGNEVVTAIHAIARGEVVLHSKIAAKLIRSRIEAQPVVEREDEPLTEREMDILRLAATGLRNKDIARNLKLSPRTVEGHLSHIFTKLGVSSRTEAIIFGASHHWYSLEQRANGPSTPGVTH